MRVEFLSREFRLSMVLVVWVTFLMSGGNAGDGTNSGQALVHTRTIAGWRRPVSLSATSRNAASAACSVVAV